MERKTKIYCSNLIKKDLIPKAKEYENRVIDIASKYGKDLAKIVKQAEEIYASSARPKNDVLSLYDSESRRKAEEEKQIELKILTDKRTAYVKAKREDLVLKAREEIRSAQNEFQEAARSVADALREKVEESVTTPLPQNFLYFARVFNEFNLPLTKMDCDVLMHFAEDNPTAYRIIESIISKTNSPYTFYGKGTDSYADDIRLIETLASDDTFCVPKQVIHQINDLFVGEPVYQKKAETLEDKIATGFNAKFDTLKISTCAGDFDYKIEKLSKMPESWSADAKVEYDAVKAYAKENAANASNQANSKDIMDAYMK